MKFTKRKFLSLSLEQQHKKCAEVLRDYYCHDSEEHFKNYQEIMTWMGIDSMDHSDQKEISDRYHEHLKNANVQLKEHHFLPHIRKNDRDTPIAEPWPIAIYLDNLRSAHNVGSILRTTEAFSLGTVYCSLNTPFIDNPKVQKTSMGTFPYVQCNLKKDVSSLPKPIIAMETSPNALSIHEFLFPDSFTLVVGNEEYGCSDSVLRETDYLIEIPLRGRKNSLNVANAFAIAAAEIFRQKQLKAIG